MQELPGLGENSLEQEIFQMNPGGLQEIATFIVRRSVWNFLTFCGTIQHFVIGLNPHNSHGSTHTTGVTLLWCPLPMCKIPRIFTDSAKFWDPDLE